MEDKDEDTIEIYEEAFSSDFDDIGFDPEYEDDNDEESAELFGY